MKGSRKSAAGALLAALSLVACGSSTGSAARPSGATTPAGGPATTGSPTQGGTAGTAAYTADGTTLQWGQTATQPFVPAGQDTGPVAVTVAVAAPVMGTITDLAGYDLDAKAKGEVPWYVTGTFKDAGTGPITDPDFDADLHATDQSGAAAQDVIITGLAKCGDATAAATPVAPGATVTSCRVFLLAPGQAIGSASFAGADGGHTVTVTWR